MIKKLVVTNFKFEQIIYKIYSNFISKALNNFGQKKIKENL